MTKQNLYQPVIVKKELDNEHFYYVDDVFYPSVTKILQSMPMPFALRKWIGDVGNEKAEIKLEKAGARGTKIHKACELLLCEGTVKLHEEFPETRDQKCIVSFMDWVNEYQPQYKKSDIELIVASTHGFAGTLDLFCHIRNQETGEDEPYIVDFKTSGGVYESHKLQITAYQYAYYEMTGVMAKRAILHLNPKLKKGFSFIGDEKMVIKKNPTTVDDYMKVFEVYKMLNGGVVPEPKEINVYPETVNLFKKGKK